MPSAPDQAPVSGRAADADPFAGIAPAWAVLAGWIAAASGLPTTTGAFADRYGQFDDADSVARFVAAVAGVGALAAELGGPAALKQDLLDNPAILQQPTPPSALYGRLVWLASSTRNTADTAAITLGALGDADTGADIAARADAVRTVLAGPGGLVEAFQATRRSAAELEAALEAAAAGIAALQRDVAATALINQANVVIGALEGTNRRWAQQSRDASLLPHGTDAPPDPAGQVAVNDAAIARKQALITDSAVLLAANDRIGVVMPGIVAAVAALGLRFQRAANQLIQFTAISSPAQLADAGWVARALDVPAMITGWRALSAAAGSFTRQALVEPEGMGT